jgi:hypothetical protein
MDIDDFNSFRVSFLSLSRDFSCSCFALFCGACDCFPTCFSLLFNKMDDQVERLEKEIKEVAVQIGNVEGQVKDVEVRMEANPSVAEVTYC